MGLYKNNNGNLELVAGGTNFAESPIGSIIPFGGTSEVVPSGWFLCDGRAISRTEYSVLFDIIGTNFGEGDGSTTFNLPDLRGEFLRGAGTNSHTNQGNGGTVGQHQDATEIQGGIVENETHRIVFGYNSTSNTPVVKKFDGFNLGDISGVTYYTKEADLEGAEFVNYLGVRPTNTSVNYIIKAKIVSIPTDFMSKVDEVVEESMSDYQKKELSTTIADATTVEGALSALNNGKVTKYNYTMVGTASLEDDIKTFVTALIALGANTYVGFFNRSGILGTAGNYSITVYAEEGTSTFASGYIAFGAGALGKTQYEVSYYKPTGSSEEWTIKKLATEDYVNKNFIRYGFYQAPDGDSYKRLMIHQSSYLNGKFCCVDRSGNEYVITIKSGTPTSFCKVNDVNSSTERIVDIRFYTEDVTKIHLYIHSVSWNNLTYYFLSDSDSKIDEFDSNQTEYNDASPITWENNFTYKVLTTDTDLNNIKTSGVYSIYISDPTSQATNHAPTYGWLQLSVIQMNNSQAFCNQVLYSADGKMFMRECGNNVWSAWKQIAIEESITLTPLNNSTIFYNKSRIVGDIVTICADIIIQSGSYLTKENAIANVPNLGTDSIGYVLPCLYRNTESGAEEPSFAIIQTGGNLYPYYTKTEYNEIRINTSYSCKL